MEKAILSFTVAPHTNTTISTLACSNDNVFESITSHITNTQVDPSAPILLTREGLETIHFGEVATAENTNQVTTAYTKTNDDIDKAILIDITECQFMTDITRQW